MFLYRIAGNFWGRKLKQIGEKYDFCWEIFRGLLSFAAPKDATLSNFTQKTFTSTHKTANSQKVFRYMVLCGHMYNVHVHVLTYWVLSLLPYSQVLLMRTHQTHPSLKIRNRQTSSKLTLLPSCAITLVPQWYDSPPFSDTTPVIAVSGRPPDLVTSPPLRAASQSRYSRPLMWV